ncbi:FAD-binding oxidoreductase [Nonomuraea sp. NPDC050663]|uniref:FAD-binding oxidoreductase n=1 Tax=Nonomuraea sp. NPDC050663 TaxID=3364370 RepID=UPI00379FE17A
MAPLLSFAPPPDWTGLGRTLKGTLVRPGDRAYDGARRLFNPAFDSVRPGGVAYCADASDVSACLAFARKNRLAVHPRSGGHSYAGWSTGPGLVVDVSRMDTVTYRDGRATVGAGAKLIDVYGKLARHGVSIPAGTCPTVGVSGLTLGGGIGVVSRKYGLTCDALESVQIVTADGRLLTCDAQHHAELFWACRGGGGGNVGVAVSFTFLAHQTAQVTAFFLHWPWRKAAAAVRTWQAWAPAAPDGLWANLHLSRDTGGLDVQIGGLFLGPQAGLAPLLKPLTDRLGAPSSRSVRQTTHHHAMMIMAGCSGLSVSQCHLPGQTRDGRLSREAFTAKSHFAYRRIPAAGVDALVSWVARKGGHTVLLDAMGGAVARVPEGATAFPHRQALFSVQYYAPGRDRSWVRGVHGALSPHLGDHAYVNYIDPDLASWRTAYYGGNAGRLAQVKAAYDPDRLFRLPQGF